MKQPTKPFALCIENTGNDASLILGKVYRTLPDPRAVKDDLTRIVDESGEDYREGVEYCNRFARKRVAKSRNRIFIVHRLDRKTLTNRPDNILSPRAV